MNSPCTLALEDSQRTVASLSHFSGGNLRELGPHLSWKIEVNLGVCFLVLAAPLEQQVHWHLCPEL